MCQSWCNIVKRQFVSKTPQEIASLYNQHTEPSRYKQASQHPELVKAMKQELEALDNNDTWEIVDLPKGKKVIGNKWVYKVKLRSDESLERYNARLVAKGYNQKHGIDYEEIFSPIVKLFTIRCILAIAASSKWKVLQLDINNAFLYGDLHEEVYMNVPEGIKT